MTFVFRGKTKFRVKKRYSIIFSGVKIEKGASTHNYSQWLPEFPRIDSPENFFSRKIRFFTGSKCTIAYFLDNIPGSNWGSGNEPSSPVTGEGVFGEPPPIYFHPSLCVNKIYSYRFSGQGIIYAASAYGKLISSSPASYEFSDNPQAGFTAGRLMTLGYHVAVNSSGIADYDTGSDDGLTTCFCRYEKDEVMTSTFELQIRELNKVQLTESQVSTFLHQLNGAKVDKNKLNVNDTFLTMRSFFPFSQTDSWGEYVTAGFGIATAPF